MIESTILDRVGVWYIKFELHFLTHYLGATGSSEDGPLWMINASGREAEAKARELWGENYLIQFVSEGER